MNNRKFQTVAVLMGGMSSEREISLRSGTAVARGLKEAGYAVTALDVKGPDFALPEGTQAVFIALHGAFGEDGQVQVLLEERRIPYVGSGPEASRIAFDKRLTKEILVRERIATPDYEILHAGEGRSLSLPVVVKPVREGSSIGVHRVMNEDEWDAAFQDALKFNGEALVEAYIDGRELTVGLVGTEALPIVEIRAPENDYNFQAKYTAGLTHYLAPAPLDGRTARVCRELARRTFQALKCRAMSRVDIRLSTRNIPYVLELNSIPGFTETSLLPKAAKCAGIEFPALCDRLMNLAALEAEAR